MNSTTAITAEQQLRNIAIGLRSSGIAVDDRPTSYDHLIEAHDAALDRIEELTGQLEEVTRWYTSLWNDVLATTPEYAERCFDWNAATYLFEQVQAIRASLVAAAAEGRAA